VRTGEDVTAGRITDPVEAGLYRISLINPDGSETPLDTTTQVRIAAGEDADFCLRFTPVFPPVGDGEGLSASEVVPDVVTSQVVFAVSGGGRVTVDVIGNVAADVNLIDPENPRRAPAVEFTRSGDEFLLTYTVYDPDLDVSRARYELLDGSGSVVQTFEVDLAGAVQSAGVLRGQSFTVEQRFRGAAERSDIQGVRVTVSDGEGNATATANLRAVSSAQSVRVRRAARVRPLPLILGTVSR
jgi:hypothetical protein